MNIYFFQFVVADGAGRAKGWARMKEETSVTPWLYIRIRNIVGSWIRIRIRIKLKIQKHKRLNIRFEGETSKRTEQTERERGEVK
jgi:hypothetical protein